VRKSLRGTHKDIRLEEIRRGSSARGDGVVRKGGAGEERRFWSVRELIKALAEKVATKLTGGDTSSTRRTV
jgi:hypothetical protein